MNEAHRSAADRVRERISRGAATPEWFRDALVDVPVEDRDAWLDRVCDIDGIPDDEPELPRGCVPYLPCSVATLLDAVELAEVGSADVFVDVGSGLGRATAFTRLFTGASCVGIEIQAALADAARRLASRLELSRTTVVQGDAAELIGSITIGTVFFLYCPFSGARLTRVLDGLEQVARMRQIRVCCVDLPLPACGWLARVPGPCSSELAVYRSRGTA